VTTLLLTMTGRNVDPMALRPEDIHLDDIVQGLVHQARFSGQTPRLYSVAEHSMGVAALVPGHLKLQALLHDAPEAYLGDVVSPLKYLPEMKPYRDAEELAWLAVAEKFGLPPEIDEVVKEADSIMLAVEAGWVFGETKAGRISRGWAIREKYTDRVLDQALAVVEGQGLLKLPAPSLGGVQQRFHGAIRAEIARRELWKEQ
jgi:hypothetical protein